jgi:hypothetical protein
VSKVEPPLRPESLEDTGIEKGMLLRLLAKWMTVREVSTPSQLAGDIKLSVSVIIPLLEELVSLGMVESRGLAGQEMSSEIRYALTMQGGRWAAAALEQSQYIGPAPVPLDAFCAQIEAQRITNEHVNRDTLARNLSHLVLPPDLIGVLGPAVNSGRSILMYGDPGNGKTSIAEALGRAFDQTICIPHSIEVGGQIISFYDEIIHQRTDPAMPSDPSGEAVPAYRRKVMDPRWVACKRPVVMTGGELTIEMLDLTFNPLSKFYEAPLHLKASGGVFIVDDFGRQRVDPQIILNRWIVPLERGFDYLTLNTGKKFAIPFDELVIFSTNIPPRQLADEATLRRLYYKVHVPSPTKADYLKIFNDVCAERDIAIDQGLLSKFFSEYYEHRNVTPAGYQPKYMVDHILAACDFYGIDPVINDKLLNYAWQHLLVEPDGSREPLLEA